MSDEAPPVPKREERGGAVRAIGRRERRRVEDAIAFVNELASDPDVRGLVIVRLYSDEDQTSIVDSFGDTLRGDLAFAGAMLTKEATE